MRTRSKAILGLSLSAHLILLAACGDSAPTEELDATTPVDTGVADRGVDGGAHDAGSGRDVDAGADEDAEVEDAPAADADAEPADAEPADAEPIDAEPIDAEVSDAVGSDAEPDDADPTDAPASDVLPSDAPGIDTGVSACDQAFAVLDACAPGQVTPIPPNECNGQNLGISECVLQHPTEACDFFSSGQVQPGPFYDCLTQVLASDAGTFDGGLPDVPQFPDIGFDAGANDGGGSDFFCDLANGYLQGCDAGTLTLGTNGCVGIELELAVCILQLPSYACAFAANPVDFSNPIVQCAFNTNPDAGTGD